MHIQKLQLLTDNLSETKKFYHEVLGLPLKEEGEKELVLVAGSTLLQFHSSIQQKPQYHFAFTIPANQIREALAWFPVQENLIPVAPQVPIADFKNWDAEAFYFFDNNGNVVEFIARRALDNGTERPFHADSLVSISEIGIVGEAVQEQCAALMEQYNLSYFSKQPPMPNFAALGDDYGLFIVVPDKRMWYPTDILSSKHWVKVAFQVNGNTEVLELHQSNEI